MKDGRTNDLDVICQHKSDGTIIPLRIRLKDEEGQYQTYTIKGYKDMSPKGAYEMPNGIYVTSNQYSFQCRIAVFGQLRTVWLLYTPSQNRWLLST